MARLAARGRVVAAPEALAPAFDRGWDRLLVEHGYERYEASNFARPGQRSRHNQAYWSNASYLGLGPGAASSLHPWRWTNRRQPEDYARAAMRGHGLRDMAERVAPLPRLLETLAVGLRTADGVPIGELDRRFGPAWREPTLTAAAPLLEAGLLVCDASRLHVPRPHLVKVDRIIGELVFRLKGFCEAPLPEQSGVG
jgi:oxygen-independent coproporphyrinogen-3 oxidase